VEKFMEIIKKLSKDFEDIDTFSYEEEVERLKEKDEIERIEKELYIETGGELAFN